MSTTNYPPKIRLLKDKYPCVKGDIYTLKYKYVSRATPAHPFTFCEAIYDSPTIKPEDYKPFYEFVPVYLSDPVAYVRYIHSPSRSPYTGDEIPADHYSKKDWFEPVPEQETPIEEEISAKLTPLMEISLKVLDDLTTELKGLKSKGWEVFKDKMKKIIEEDEKKS